MKRGRPGWIVPAAIAVLLGVCAIAGLGAVQLITEYAWFGSLGRQQILTQLIATRLAFWAAGSIFAFAVFRFTAVLAERIAGAERFTSLVATVTAVALAAVMGAALSAHWMTLRLALDGVGFGVTDPQFGRDVGFFVFVLPALERLSTWLQGVVIISIFIMIGVTIAPKVVRGDHRAGGSWSRIKPVLSVQLALLMLYAAFEFLASRWRLELSAGGQLFGASYTDVHTRIPAYSVMALVSLGLAVAFLLFANRIGWRGLTAAFGSWVVLGVALASIWPSVVQDYVVEPNEATMERPFIERNLAMTRQAWGIARVDEVACSIADTLTPDAATQAADAVARTRIWTPATVARSFEQLQRIRPYYRLSPIQPDRYVVAGEAEQVLVAAREIDTSRLPARARTWVNRHLVFTHGYGLVIGQANAATEAGLPRFLLGGIPPRVPADSRPTPELETVRQPRVYFGPDMEDYAIVDTGLREFDYPVGQHNATNRYKGDGGVVIGHGPSRAMWAVRLGSYEMLMSRYVRPESRVLMYRDIKTRVAKLAPWLQLDASPYPALVDGRIVWILDGYTSSDHYPYAQPYDGTTNYLRNSVKVTVDALTGRPTFYAIGSDPLRDAWARMFPGLIVPEQQMPKDLVAHLRYPQRMLEAESVIYRDYHVADATVFYNKEDEWDVAHDENGLRAKPAYLMLDASNALRGAALGRNMYVALPYAPLSQDNLIGWSTVGCGPAGYGDHTVYLLPKGQVVFGARQILARINQDPAIAPQLALWSQRGIDVVFGEMTIVPVQGTIAYVQPIFLQAAQSSIPELAGVVVATQDRLAMERTLSAAAEKVFAHGL